jgi:hypothetical protein
MLKVQGIVNIVSNILTIYDVAMSVKELIANGGSFDDVVDAIVTGVLTSVAINKLCGMSIVMRIGFAIFSVLEEAQAMQEAFEDGNTGQGISRAIRLGITILEAIFSSCFTGDTLVATEDGQRPIEEIKAGDYVWATDVKTGEKDAEESRGSIQKRDLYFSTCYNRWRDNKYYRNSSFLRRRKRLDRSGRIKGRRCGTAFKW